MKTCNSDYREIVTPLAVKRLDVFFNHVFRDSLELVEGRFVPGAHIDGWCQRLQAHRKTSTKSARKHAKSHTFYAFLLWLLYRLMFDEAMPRYMELLYLSYKDDLSQYHLKLVKRYLKANPWFAGLESLTDAESILHYKVPVGGSPYDGRELLIEPEGILSFKRGRHPHGVLADDVLRDPTVRLDLTQIQKITRIFMEEVVSLPKEDGFLHVAGTAQDAEDLFAELERMGSFNCADYPALINEATREVLWPQMFPYARLVEIRDKEIGPKAFLKEYQCRSVREVSGYFDQAELDAVIDPALRPWDGAADRSGAQHFAGLDLGKKSHPSHLAVFRREGETLIQVISRWFDRTDYTEQVACANGIHEQLGLTGLAYDDTRAELESFAERKELPPRSTGVAMTAKAKFEMAAALGRRIRYGTIRLLDDPRQKRQLLAVDDNLDAPATPEGHGDSFWSICLAVASAERAVTPRMHVLTIGEEEAEA